MQTKMLRKTKVRLKKAPHTDLKLLLLLLRLGKDFNALFQLLLCLFSRLGCECELGMCLFQVQLQFGQGLLIRVQLNTELLALSFHAFNLGCTSAMNEGGRG